MSTIKIHQNWLLKSQAEPCAPAWDALHALFNNENELYTLPAFPMQVHDVLLAHGVIENPNVQGINHDTWIHQRDWAYCCRFDAQAGVPSVLKLEGLDTFADIWLNGQLLGSTNDAYLSWQYDVSALVQAHNTLIVYFHASLPRVNAVQLPAEMQGLVPQISAVRVFRTSYHDYCGPSPCLIRCGLYGDVELVQATPAALTDVVCDVQLLDSGDGLVTVDMDWIGQGEDYTITIADQDGCTVASFTAAQTPGRARAELTVPQPRLWFPWTHGRQPLYTLRITCGQVQAEKVFGFRKVEISDRLTFRVNGMPVRPWGANLMHLDTLTNCYNPEKMARMLDLAQLSHCNMLRVWGEADKLPEAFYTECDRRGIMLWQDFFMGCSLYPEDEEQLRLHQREAEMLIRAYKHHPSIMLWCGGNELYLARDYQHPDAPVYGEKIVNEVYAQVCRREDPNRLYYPTSPCGGRWANDPQGGDTHGYTHLWFVPGREYPVFLSENCRVSTASWLAMQKMMTPEELWPEGYHGGLTAENPYEWPACWNRHTPNEGWRKLGPVEHYRDAVNPWEMVYRVGAAHEEYIHEQVSRFRRGRFPWEKEAVRHTGGHLLWRLNDNCNVNSFGVVDYFLEPCQPFYEMKRCYQPLFASVELADNANIWLTNDTPCTVEGTVEISLFHMLKNCFVAQKTVAFAIGADQSNIVCNLDDWGQIRKENIICVRVLDKQRNILAEEKKPLDIERRLVYPSSVDLSMYAENGEVILQCHQYARCVVLTGEELGWVFEDNFFDLVPGEVKRVRVLRCPHSGLIHARTAFDATDVTCMFDEKE